MVIEKEGRGLYTPIFPIAQCTEVAAFGDCMHQHRVDWLGIELLGSSSRSQLQST